MNYNEYWMTFDKITICIVIRTTTKFAGFPDRKHTCNYWGTVSSCFFFLSRLRNQNKFIRGGKISLFLPHRLSEKSRSGHFPVTQCLVLGKKVVLSQECSVTWQKFYRSQSFPFLTILILSFLLLVSNLTIASWLLWNTVCHTVPSKTLILRSKR